MTRECSGLSVVLQDLNPLSRFGSSGLFGLSRLFGSMNQKDKTDPRTRETALGSSFVKR
jgi:hypothetical protein